MVKHRLMTRRQRYQHKRLKSKKYPLEVATVNFLFDGNVGYVVRAAACFGAARVNIIGSMPNLAELKAASGGTSEFIEIRNFSSPEKFLETMRQENVNLVAGELTSDAVDLTNYRFCENRMVCRSLPLPPLLSARPSMSVFWARRISR